MHDNKSQCLSQKRYVHIPIDNMGDRLKLHIQDMQKSLSANAIQYDRLLHMKLYEFLIDQSSYTQITQTKNLFILIDQFVGDSYSNQYINYHFHMQTETEQDRIHIKSLNSNCYKFYDITYPISNEYIRLFDDNYDEIKIPSCTRRIPIQDITLQQNDILQIIDTNNCLQDVQMLEYVTICEGKKNYNIGSYVFNITNNQYDIQLQGETDNVIRMLTTQSLIVDLISENNDNDDYMILQTNQVVKLQQEQYNKYKIITNNKTLLQGLQQITLSRILPSTTLCLLFPQKKISISFEVELLYQLDEKKPIDNNMPLLQNNMPSFHKNMLTQNMLYNNTNNMYSKMTNKYPLGINQQKKI